MSISGAFQAIAESMKSQPGLLAVLIVSVSWAGVTYLAVQNRDIRAHEQQIAILERCWPLTHEKSDLPGAEHSADAK